MRLFLSSQGLGNHVDRLMEMIGDNKKVLFIDNAKDDLDRVERADHVAKKRQDFAYMGMDFEELDLRDYFGKNKSKLADRLQGIGLLMVSGGNTFILRRAMHYSGLDKLLVDSLMHDKFVYAGSSAGSIIMAPSLHGTEHGDSPDTTPKHYKKEVVWQGLNLVDFYIVPHYLSDWLGVESQLMKDYFEEKSLPHVALMDGQVYVVDGNHQELLK